MVWTMVACPVCKARKGAEVYAKQIGEDKPLPFWGLFYASFRCSDCGHRFDAVSRRMTDFERGAVEVEKARRERAWATLDDCEDYDDENYLRFVR